MTDNTHPSYPNPTIQEALCEIQFVSNASQFGSDFARVWQRIQPVFPALETYVDVLLPVENGVLQGSLPCRPRFLLRHANRQVLVQLSPGSFTLNTLSPYLGWQTMREDILEAWSGVQEALTLSEVNRISLRYIDRVPQPPHLIGLGRWLNAGDYVPQTVAIATPPFQSRVQTGAATGGTMTLTISHQNAPGPDAAMIADFERVIAEVHPSSPAKIVERLDALHEDIWQLFADVKGLLWNDALEGRQG